MRSTDVKILYVYYAARWGKSWAGAVIITYINAQKLSTGSIRPLVDEMKPGVRILVDESTIKCLELRCGIDIEAFVSRVELALTKNGYSVTVENHTAIS